MINAKDHDGFVLARFDPMHDDIRQSRHDNFARTGKCSLVADVRKLDEKSNRFPDPLADAPGRVRIPFPDIVSNAIEMPLGAAYTAAS